MHAKHVQVQRMQPRIIHDRVAARVHEDVRRVDRVVKPRPIPANVRVVQVELLNAQLTCVHHFQLSVEPSI